MRRVSVFIHGPLLQIISWGIMFYINTCLFRSVSSQEEAFSRLQLADDAREHEQKDGAPSIAACGP